METEASVNNLPAKVILSADSSPEGSVGANSLAIPRDQSISPASSPVSEIESTFSPRPSTPSRRLSTSTSISSTSSFYSCSTSGSQATNHPKGKGIKTRTSCFQCTTLGLRCSLSREPLRRGQDRSTNFCLRCAASGEPFCILQHETRDEFWADGADDSEVEERVDELLAPKRERWKWCLPKIPPGGRAGLRRVFSRSSELEEVIHEDEGKKLCCTSS